MKTIGRTLMTRTILTLVCILFVALGAISGFLLLSYIAVLSGILETPPWFIGILGSLTLVFGFWMMFWYIPPRLSNGISQLLHLGFPRGFVDRSSVRIYLGAVAVGACGGAMYWGLSLLQFLLFVLLTGFQ